MSDEDRGVNHLIVDCEDPILIIEQANYAHSQHPWRSVQKVARNESHTSFTGRLPWTMKPARFFFRDTLRLDTLDRSELEGSITALELALADNAAELLEYSHQ